MLNNVAYLTVAVDLQNLAGVPFQCAPSPELTTTVSTTSHLFPSIGSKSSD
jgi:hypothetical protein